MISIHKWPKFKNDIEWCNSWWSVKGVGARDHLREHDIKWDKTRNVIYLHSSKIEYLEIFVTDEESETMLKLMSE